MNNENFKKIFLPPLKVRYVKYVTDNSNLAQVKGPFLEILLYVCLSFIFQIPSYSVWLVR